MKRYTRYRRLGAVAAAGLLALALLPPAAHAEIKRTGDEPWYRQATADARQRAQALFAQAVDKHLQLLRGDARDFYDQALALWDNPDIQWNLALVLEQLGTYLRAYQQLDGAVRWGEALGAERLRDVHDRMQALESQRLARIDASSDEPGADIMLDGQPWFRGAGRQSTLVEPGEHYIAARKAGFFPVTRSVSVRAGHAARVALPMDADRLLETRRWSWWKPWVVASAGVVVIAVGAGLERQAFKQRDAAATHSPRAHCTACISSRDKYDLAVMESRLAVGAYLVGGTSMLIGLTMVWINQLHAHRTEARRPGPIELTPLLSPDQAGVSARIRF